MRFSAILLLLALVLTSCGAVSYTPAVVLEKQYVTYTTSGGGIPVLTFTLPLHPAVVPNAGLGNEGFETSVYVNDGIHPAQTATADFWVNDGNFIGGVSIAPPISFAVTDVQLFDGTVDHPVMKTGTFSMNNNSITLTGVLNKVR